MTLQQLQYLLEVYHTGSISGAAKNLFLAQSSLSASISSIENELGFPIFVRAKKGMIPTVEGSHVITHAASICESYQAMLNSSTARNYHLRISAPDYPPLNQAFSKLVHTYQNNPGIRFSIDTCCTAEASKRLSAHELDIAMLINHEARILAVDTLLDSMGLQRQQIASVPAVIRIGQGHRLYHEEAVSADDFANDLFIDNMNDPLIDNDFLKGVIRLSKEQTVSVKNAHIQSEMICQGLGYTITASEKQHPTEKAPFRSIPIEGVNYIFSAVTNPKSERHEAVDTYLSFIQQEFS